jgi:hypothetical protein
MSTKSEYKKKWKSLNKEREKENNKRWNQENREEVQARKEQYYIDNASELKINSSEWRKKNRDKINKSIKENPSKRIGMNIRSKISKIVKGKIKESSTLSLLGCSMAELKIHLESQFQSGMSWENYGMHGWHIDHIRPLSSFTLINNDELRLAWHYSNLQPLWAADNLKKGSKYEY